MVDEVLYRTSFLFDRNMRISLLIPCFNEEKSIRASALSWLAQTRPADEIIVVNDSSTDSTLKILAEFSGKIKVITTPKNTGNKSHAQEYGLRFVTGEIFVATDGDTLLDKNFIKNIEKDFADPKVAAVGGYVRSLRYNWLTACRALDYIVGQNLDKLAQDYIGYMFVIPGAAGAFRTDLFRQNICFDHDTITEDLDFTYKLHKLGFKIIYNRKAICYTQDPSTLSSYINQMRRWYGGGWQNLLKHLHLPDKPGMALALSLIYIEGLVFSALLFLVPFISIASALVFLVAYSVIVVILSICAAVYEKRSDILFVLPGYLLLKYINAWVYLEQFVKEVIFRKKNLVWFQPERVEM